MKLSESTNVTKVEEVGVESTSMGTAIALMSVSLSSIIINLVFISTGLKTKKLEFQKLSVIIMLFSDIVLGLSSFLYALLTLTDPFVNTTTFCLIQSFSLTFCGLTTYGFNFLICIQRYVAVNSFNYGSNRFFNNNKYFVIISVFFSILIYSMATTFLTPYVSHCKECRLRLLYEDYFVIYFALSFGVLTVLMLAIISLTFVTGYHIFKVFFRTKIKPAIQTNNHFDGNKVCSNDTSSVRVIKFDHFITELSNLHNYKNPDTESLTDNKQRRDTVITPIDVLSVTDIEIEPSVNSSTQCSVLKHQSNVDCISSKTNNASSNRRNSFGHTCQSTDLKKQKRWEIRAFLTCVVVVSSTLIFTGPVIVSFWVEFISNQTPSKASRTLIGIIYLLNLIVDPFIYAWRMPEIRVYLRNLFRRST